MYPEHKGTITAMVMFASSVSNYVVINAAGVLAKTGGVNGPRNILLFNMSVTCIGVLFAVVLNIRYGNEMKR